MDFQYFNSQTKHILNLGFDESKLPQLKSYLEFLWQENEELNLISRKMTVEDLIDNHVIDCLLPLSHFPKNIRTVADFGSGGGLPAIIFAIQFPQVQFHLFEKSPLKQKFLESCKDVAAPNLQIHGEIPHDLNGIDLVTARGFKPIDVILSVSRSYHLKGGKYFLLKARLEKIEEELSDARRKFKHLSPVIIPLKSPVLEVERNLVVI